MGTPTRTYPFVELPPRVEPPVLSDANMPEILSMEVPGARTRDRIWMNRPQYPDDVVIALG
jgi:hypothetical protein